MQTLLLTIDFRYNTPNKNKKLRIAKNVDESMEAVIQILGMQSNQELAFGT